MFTRKVLYPFKRHNQFVFEVLWQQQEDPLALLSKATEVPLKKKSEQLKKKPSFVFRLICSFCILSSIEFSVVSYISYKFVNERSSSWSDFSWIFLFSICMSVILGIYSIKNLITKVDNEIHNHTGEVPVSLRVNQAVYMIPMVILFLVLPFITYSFIKGFYIDELFEIGASLIGLSVQGVLAQSLTTQAKSTVRTILFLMVLSLVGGFYTVNIVTIVLASTYLALGIWAHNEIQNIT